MVNNYGNERGLFICIISYKSQVNQTTDCSCFNKTNTCYLMLSLYAQVLPTNLFPLLMLRIYRCNTCDGQIIFFFVIVPTIKRPPSSKLFHFCSCNHGWNNVLFCRNCIQCFMQKNVLDYVSSLAAFCRLFRVFNNVHSFRTVHNVEV